MRKLTPWKINIVLMEVWFRSFSFLFMVDGCRFQPLICQGVPFIGGPMSLGVPGITLGWREKVKLWQRLTVLWAFVEELGRPYQGGGSFPGGKVSLKRFLFPGN